MARTTATAPRDSRQPLMPGRLKLMAQLLWPLAIAGGFFLFSHPFLSPPDCVFYWAWAESIFRYLSLDFSRVFEKFEMPLYYCSITSTGRLSNDWPIGSGLIIGPWSLLPPQYAHAWLFWLTGAAFAAWWRWVPAEVTGRMKAAAVAGTLFGTPMLFYAYFGPFFSHVASFAVVTLFLCVWARFRGAEGWKVWLILGFLLGFAFVVRPQNLLLALVFLPDVHRWWRWAGRAPGAAGRGAAALIIGALAGSLPRYLPYAVLYGHPLALPKAEEMQWFAPEISGLLFSDLHGVLPWTPVTFVGLLGLLVLGQRQRAVAAGLALVFAVQVYVNAANEVWWSGGSFGSRRLADYSIIVCFGLAALFGSRSRAVRWSSLAAVCLCCLWTLLLILAERRLLLPLYRYIAFDSRDFRQALRLTVAEPGQTWHALTSHVKENTLHRAMAAAGLAAGLYGLSWIAGRNRRRPIVEARATNGRVTAIVAIACVALTVPAGWAALRTGPQTDREITSKLGSRSSILYDNYLELANYRLVRNELMPALKAAQKATHVRPKHYSGYFYQALAFIEMRRFAEAATNLERVVEMYPAHPEAAKMLQQARVRAWVTSGRR